MKTAQKSIHSNPSRKAIFTRKFQFEYLQIRQFLSLTLIFEDGLRTARRCNPLRFARALSANAVAKRSSHSTSVCTTHKDIQPFIPVHVSISRLSQHTRHNPIHNRCLHRLGSNCGGVCVIIARPPITTRLRYVINQYAAGKVGRRCSSTCAVGRPSVSGRRWFVTTRICRCELNTGPRVVWATPFSRNYPPLKPEVCPSLSLSVAFVYRRWSR